MPQISHAYAVGRVRSLERTLLTGAALDRLASAPSAKEAIRMLSEAGWGDAQDAAQVDRLAEGHMRRACELVKAISPETAVTDCFLIKFDILNIKTLLKARLMGSAAPQLNGNGLIDPERLRHAVSENSYLALPPEYLGAMKKIEQRIAVDPDPLFIDSQLDKLMFRLIGARLSGAKNPPEEIVNYFSAKADFVNLLISLRAGRMGRDADFAREMFVEGGKLDADHLAQVVEDPAKAAAIVRYRPYAEAIKRGMERFERGEGIAPLEKQMDDFLLSLIRPARYRVLSVLPLAGYLLARERETAAVRLIITAKSVGASEETLNGRLRELYA